MIKRTLYFGNPSYLHLCNKQLVVRLPEVEKNDTLPDSFKKEATATIPIEDIAVLILDDKQVTGDELCLICQRYNLKANHNQNTLLFIIMRICFFDKLPQIHRFLKN